MGCLCLMSIQTTDMKPSLLNMFGENSDIIDYVPEFADSLSDLWDSTINGESVIDDSDPHGRLFAHTIPNQ